MPEVSVAQGKKKKKKEKRIFDKIFAEMGDNCKKKYENFTIFSYLAHDREKEIKDRKKTGQNISFFHKKWLRTGENGR